MDAYNAQLQNWDAFIALALFLPTLLALLWEFSPPGVRRVWERKLLYFSKDGNSSLQWDKKIVRRILAAVIVPYLVVEGLFIALSFRGVEEASHAWLPWLPAQPPLWVLTLTLLLALDLFFAIVAFILSRPGVVLTWIRWRIRVHWRERENFDDAFERYRSLLRVLGRESRGGEETNMVLQTVRGVVQDILNTPSQKGPYEGNELSGLLQDIVPILLDSPHRPTPANFRHAARIFTALFQHFKTLPPSQCENCRDIQAALESIARLGQYIVRDLPGDDYDEALSRLLRLFQQCRHGGKHLSRALRDITIPLLWPPPTARPYFTDHKADVQSLRWSPLTAPPSFFTDYKVALQSLTSLEKTILTLPLKETISEPDMLHGLEEIFYDYLSVLTAFCRAGQSACARARQRWLQRRRAILAAYQRLMRLSGRTKPIPETFFWAQASRHHRMSGRFPLADGIDQVCREWRIGQGAS